MKKLAGNGDLVAFNRTPGYLYLKAKENHKAGNYVQAAGLYCRALEGANRSDIQYDLGMLYKEMECYELAVKYLYQAMALDSAASDGFYELAVNLCVMEKREATLDAAAMYLKREPFGVYAYHAQDLIDWAMAPDMNQSGRRFLRLMELAGRDEQAGRKERAANRLMRAARLKGDSCDRLFELSLRLNALGYTREALRMAKEAVRYFPKQVKSYCALSAAVFAMGRQPLAAAIMEKLSGCVPKSGEQRIAFQTAQMVNAGLALERWLTKVLVRNPFDSDALYILAYSQAQKGQMQEAKQYLEKMLAFDGFGHQAREALLLIHQDRKEDMAPPDTLTAASVELCVGKIMEFANRSPGDLDTEEKFWLDWLFTMPIGSLCEEMLDLMAQHAPQQAIAFFKMWLVDESINETVRETIAYRLGRMLPEEMQLILSGGRLAFTTVKPIAVLEKNNRSTFIKRFMVETRELKAGNEMARYAAAHYDRLTRRYKTKACGKDAYAFIAALKLIYLKQKGLDRQFALYAKDVLISLRRIDRAMKIFERTNEGDKENEAD